MCCLTGGRTFFIANTSTLLKTAQLYEFQAETPKEKEMYEYVHAYHICNAIKLDLTNSKNLNAYCVSKGS